MTCFYFNHLFRHFLDLPLFNSDIKDFPESVTKWRELAKSADAFIIATNEYNFSISGVLKNAIDWASVGPHGNCFADKPAAVISAGGGVGGLRATMHLRDIALFLNLHIMNTPSMQVAIFSQPSPFDMSTGDLIDEDQIKRAGDVVAALMTWTSRLQTKVDI